MPEWRWCLEKGCAVGRVHENVAKREKQDGNMRERKVRFLVERDRSPSPVEVRLSPEWKNAQEEEKEEPGVWTCHGKKCQGQACVTCDRPWHEGFTCSEFAWRSMRHLVEDALSRKVIEALRAEGRVKSCPNCQGPIEKEGPGQEVYCTMCLCRFRWEEA